MVLDWTAGLLELNLLENRTKNEYRNEPIKWGVSSVAVLLKFVNPSLADISYNPINHGDLSYEYLASS